MMQTQTCTRNMIDAGRTVIGKLSRLMSDIETNAVCASRIFSGDDNTYVAKHNNAT